MVDRDRIRIRAPGGDVGKYALRFKVNMRKKKMKVRTRKRVLQSEIVRVVADALNISEWCVHMPFKSEGFVWVEMLMGLKTWNLTVPNDTLAEMIWGDRWDGDASDGAFKFGGGGLDPVWFECGVELPADELVSAS